MNSKILTGEAAMIAQALRLWPATYYRTTVVMGRWAVVVLNGVN